MKKEKVLIAGATGYLGRYISQEIIKSEYDSRLIVRNQGKSGFNTSEFEIIEAQVTQPESLNHVFEGVDYVISTIGITRQKDGLTYMDVDYQANVNLVNNAKANGIKKFIYVSVLNGEKLRYLKICEAKEKLVDYLKASGLDYCVIRPNGFFSDMKDFLKMAKSGKVYLFGNGEFKLNPIHGEDLAKICIDAIQGNQKEIEVGGPEILSQNEIACLALNAHSKPEKIIHLPDWMRRFSLWAIRNFTSSRTYGPIEFFLTTMNMDMIAPCFGVKNLEEFFREKVK